jgi:hypothetical protein
MKHHILHIARAYNVDYKKSILILKIFIYLDIKIKETVIK